MNSCNQAHNKRVEIIKALAHPTRLRIVEILSEKTLCVGDIRKITGGDLSTISKHLTIMREAGWITCEKKGLQIHYSLACVCLDEFFQCLDSLSSDQGCC